MLDWFYSWGGRVKMGIVDSPFELALSCHLCPVPNWSYDWSCHARMLVLGWVGMLPRFVVTCKTWVGCEYVGAVGK